MQNQFGVVLKSRCPIESMDRIVLDINAICANLGKTCLQLFSIYTLSGCDTTPYHYGKGNTMVLNSHQLLSICFSTSLELIYRSCYGTQQSVLPTLINQQLLFAFVRIRDALAERTAATLKPKFNRLEMGRMCKKKNLNMVVIRTVTMVWMIYDLDKWK